LYLFCTYSKKIVGVSWRRLPHNLRYTWVSYMLAGEPISRTSQRAVGAREPVDHAEDLFALGAGDEADYDVDSG